MRRVLTLVALAALVGTTLAAAPSYADGYVAPHHSRTRLDTTLQHLWKQWRTDYLTPGCEPGQLRVRTGPQTTGDTVSEGQGYGMLLAVLFDARSRFDQLYAYVLAHPSSIEPGLMAWAQDRDCQDVGGADSATDGDLDIAYALLLADRRWGSDGAVDYAAGAGDAIGAIRRGELADDAHLQLGDWAPGTSYAHGTRLSDQMTGHLKAFARLAPDHRARWREAVRRSFDTIAELRRRYASPTGLVPDFAVGLRAGSDPRPAPADWLEGPNDGRYSYNACRVPWRLAADYLTTGDARAGRGAERISDWARRTTHGRPGRLHDGYTLSGRPISGGHSLAFLAPVGAAAAVDLDGVPRAGWVTRIWDRLAAAPSQGYYPDSLRLLSMVVMADRWRRP